MGSDAGLLVPDLDLSTEVAEATSGIELKEGAAVLEVALEGRC